MANIFEGKTKQITYNNGKFYLASRQSQNDNFPPLNANQEIPQQPNIPYVSDQFEGTDGKMYSIAIVQSMGHTSVYQCCFEPTGLIYKQCPDLDTTNQAVDWENINPAIQNTVTDYFWQKEQSEMRNTAPSQSPISDGQKAQIKQMVLSGNGLSGTSLETIKKACQSRTEYAHCLKYLIEGGNSDPSLSAQLVSDINDIRSCIAAEKLEQLPLNSSNFYGGHIATTGEIAQYIHDFFVAELKANQPGYQPPPLNLQDASWNTLCSPGANVPVVSVAVQNQGNQILANIMAIHSAPPTSPSLKQNLTQTQLMDAIQAMNVVDNTDWKSPLGQYIRPFLSQICKSFGHTINMGPEVEGSGPFGFFQNNLLPPVRALALNRLDTINHTTLLDAPTKQQCIPLRVDLWDGEERYAKHSDFVKFQLEHPQAILLIPDNFTDAALADNRRHMREGRGNLAGQMAPRDLSQTAQPLYDLCTLGIPTGGETNLNEQQQKDKVQDYLARLYGELRHGRTIAIPRTQEHGVDEWAFGGGLFARSNLTRFIQAELNKLQQFCNGGLSVDNLDPKYKAAWNNPQPPLPLPALQMAQEDPAPAPVNELEGIQADRNLTNAGFRVKLQEWLQDNGHGALKEEKGIWHAQLSTGVKIAVYQDKILVNKPSGELSDAELKTSINQILDAYIHAHQPGNPPPLKALGTEKQKEIIRELITSKGIPLDKEKEATENVARTPVAQPQPANNPQPPAAPGPSM